MTVFTNEVVEPFDTSNKKLLSTVMLQESIAADRSVHGGQSAAAKGRRPHRQKIPPPPFLSVRQLAQAGNISPKTVYSWLAAQKIPPSQVKRWRSILVIHQDDAARFLTAVEPVGCDAQGGGE